MIGNGAQVLVAVHLSNYYEISDLLELVTYE